MFTIIRIILILLMLITIIILLPKVKKDYKSIAKSIIEINQAKTDYYKTQQQILQELKKNKG